MIRTVLKIDGMACGMCEAHVNDTIRKEIPEAKKVSSSFRKGEAEFLTDNRYDTDSLCKAIGDTGYRVLSVDCAEVKNKKGWFHFR